MHERNLSTYRLSYPQASGTRIRRVRKQQVGQTLVQLILWSAALVLSANVKAEEAQHAIDDHAVCAPNGIAVGGYDVVSYFDSGLLMGSATITHKHNNLTYQFANQENLQKFVKSPEDFLPKYRGWCSATLSMGRLACPDFANYKIENGALLLFERIGFSNGLDMWNADPVTASRNANAHFERLIDEARSSKPHTE